MKKVISIFLLTLILVSNAGVTMATHLCGGKAVKSVVTLGHSDLDCGMMQMEMECSNEQLGKEALLKSKCCDNQYTSIESEDTTFNKLITNSINLEFLVALTYTYAGLNPFSQEYDTPYTNYSPPLLKQDRPVLYQTFLI